jgi:hypothetical protein
MKSVVEKFSEHPREQGETYLEHLRQAVCCGLLFSVASGACIVHAVFPFMLKEVATGIAKGVLNKRCKHQK